MTMSDKAIQIAEAIRKITDFRPEIGFILGSGWGKAAENLREKQTIPYADLPGMPLCGVAGHAGNFLFGVLGGRRVVIVQGRIHLYEGRPIEDVLLPVRILDALGVRDLLLTNAAGGADPSFSPGDLMVVRDHINLTGVSPLRGVQPTAEYPVFIDMTRVYDEGKRKMLAGICESEGVKIHEGVYFQVMGPAYETPAEVAAYRKLGADAIGMSTAVEATFAHYRKMRVAALSCITNKAAGVGGASICHEEVLQQAQRNEKLFARLLGKIAEAW